MSNDTKELSKDFLILLIVVCLFLIIIIGVGFILYSNREREVIVEEKSVGSVTLNYSSTTNGLSITKTSSMTDAVGIKNENYFDFSVKSNLEDEQEVEYEIAISKNKSKSTISDEEIKIYLEKEENGIYSKVFGPKAYVGLKKQSKVGSKVGEMVIANVSRNNSGTDNYRLRIWMSDQCILDQGDYSIDVNLYADVK